MPVLPFSSRDTSATAAVSGRDVSTGREVADVKSRDEAELLIRGVFFCDATGVCTRAEAVDCGR